MGSACSTHVEKRNGYTIFVGKPEGKRLLGRLKRRWEDNIKMVREIGWSGKDQSRVLVNTVMNLRVPYNMGKFLSS
jgi:hypothetical protein